MKRKISKAFRKFLPQFLRNQDEKTVAKREYKAFPLWAQMKNLKRWTPPVEGGGDP